MQSLEHRALAQTARTQFKERQQSMVRFHPSHRPPGNYWLINIAEGMDDIKQAYVTNMKGAASSVAGLECSGWQQGTISSGRIEHIQHLRFCESGCTRFHEGERLAFELERPVAIAPQQ